MLRTIICPCCDAELNVEVLVDYHSIVRHPKSQRSEPWMCDHANENPAQCRCPAWCYCKGRTCPKEKA